LPEVIVPDDITSDGPVFHMRPLGMLANKMIEYMVALNFVSQVPGCRISNFSLPEWEIEHPPIESPGPVISIDHRQRIDIPALVRAVRDGTARRIEWSGYGQRMENFLPRADYKDIFIARTWVPAGFGAKHLVCPVRAGDILGGSYCDYPLTPVEFYQEIVALTGLRPVFVGQTELNDYTNRLRDQFPSALFVPSAGPIGDFEMIRQSKNIVVGVSTFIWLAAWLSQADNIFMAVNGLFNPMQQRSVALLPFGDPRYRFWLFPFNGGVPLDRHAAYHRRLAPCWRRMPHELLQRLTETAPREKRMLAAMLSVFDESYYLDENADVAAAVRSGGYRNGEHHYRLAGFEERRLPLAFDAFWYAERYLSAAIEVGQGDYDDLLHHFAMIGRRRGYAPRPG
jgi:hypothetical protein